MNFFKPAALFATCSILAACDSGVELGFEEQSTISRNVFIQTDENTRNDPTQWFDEADVLAETGHTETVYLEQVAGLLTHYVDVTKDPTYPTGLNYEVTNLLLGKNSTRIAVIDVKHPKINSNGEIIDSWGTPYFFHSETSSDISIQSAGPDLLHYTDDDIVFDEMNTLAGSAVIDTIDSTDETSLQIGLALPVQSHPNMFDTFENGELLSP